jgi:hypothetical protein
MLLASVAGGILVGIVAAVVVVAAGLWLLSRCVKIVQQGSVGVVKRLGEFKPSSSLGCTSCPRLSTECRRSTYASSP